MNLDSVIKKLEEKSNPEAVKFMAKYGITPEKNMGVSVTNIRAIAKDIGKNHELAIQLWETGIRDARILAPHIEEVEKVTEEQMDSWVKDFNSWDVCDNCCGFLFDKTPYNYKKAFEWSKREKEFEKRAGFALIAWLTMHDKKSDDKIFEKFLYVIKKESTDERNYVKKAVNWALRQIGKRNLDLNKKAIDTAKEIQRIDSKSAKWIASDAIRELTSEKIKIRLEKRAGK
jgi:3-methyladenine DNA glycosylase AlkD